MSEVKTTTENNYLLPPNVVSRVDMAHMVQDIERIDNQLTEASVHAKVKAPSSSDTTMSDQLKDFLDINSLEIPQNGTQRTQFVKQLRQLADKAPVVHMTFAVEADRESLAQIAAWLRKEIHPQALVSVGLQPALVAGVYMRTTNHVHDFSLRAKLAGSHDILLKQLRSYHAA